MNERDALGGDSACDQLVADAHVHVPLAVVCRDGAIAEDDLESATQLGLFAEVIAVGVVVGGVVLLEDAGGDLAGSAPLGRCGQMGASGVEGDVAAVVGDLEGVVQIHPLGVDGVGPVTEVLDEVLDLLAGLEVDNDVGP